MLIECPWCGPRSLGEYSYGGDAGKTRPTNAGSKNLPAWIEFVFLRDNPAGHHQEYWHHTNGCRSWLFVERNTLTHEIFGVSLASESRQDIHSKENQ